VARAIRRAAHIALVIARHPAVSVMRLARMSSAAESAMSAALVAVISPETNGRMLPADDENLQ